MMGSVSTASPHPRTSHHSDCTKHKASFLYLWALLGTLMGNVHMHIRERNSSQQFQPNPQAVNRKLLIDPIGWKEIEKGIPLKEKDRSLKPKILISLQ